MYPGYAWFHPCKWPLHPVYSVSLSEHLRSFTNCHQLNTLSACLRVQKLWAHSPLARSWQPMFWSQPSHASSQDLEAWGPGTIYREIAKLIIVMAVWGSSTGWCWWEDPTQNTPRMLLDSFSAQILILAPYSCHSPLYHANRVIVHQSEVVPRAWDQGHRWSAPQACIHCSDTRKLHWSSSVCAD